MRQQIVIGKHKLSKVALLADGDCFFVLVTMVFVIIYENIL